MAGTTHRGGTMARAEGRADLSIRCVMSGGLIVIETSWLPRLQSGRVFDPGAKVKLHWTIQQFRDDFMAVSTHPAGIRFGITPSAGAEPRALPRGAVAIPWHPQ